MEFLKSIKFVKKLSRKKDDPAKYDFTGDLKTYKIDIQLFKYKWIFRFDLCQ